MTKISNNFNGNIDELLYHCASVDDVTLEQALELEKAIEHIMTELDVDRSEAMQIIEDIHLAEVQQTINDMVAKGLMEIIGYNESGEPLYNLTQRGKEIRDQID